jgi:hypothetical protein
MKTEQGERMDTKAEPPEPVNILINQKDDKVIVRFDRALNFLVIEPVAAIRIGELIKEKGIEILRQDV